MRYVYLKKENLPGLIDFIGKSRKVMAPVKKENQFVFSEIEDSRDVVLDYLPTILSPKKYFMPQHQRLGTFKMGEVTMDKTEIKVQPTVLFGVHTCDIEGIECLDIVFNHDPRDPYFRKLKKSIVIVGFECNKPCDENATCVTMGTHNPKAGYDIMFTDAGDKFILHINSQAGEELIGKCELCEDIQNKEAAMKTLAVMRDKKNTTFKKALDASYKELKGIFDESYDSKTWEGVGKRCVSCGNCTAVCPTCYCFDIYDNVELNMSGGERNRVWDSCQLEEFAKVAGNENFRKDRSERQRHRYYRKFNYSVKKYKKYFCIGCGRCTRTCMAKISLIDTVNELTKEQKNG